jgi:hypothetical protein
MRKQTAVEWLIEQLLKNENIRWRGTHIYELSEQAKQREKQQMVDSLHYFGIENAEQYYNETYKKD